MQFLTNFWKLMTKYGLFLSIFSKTEASLLDDESKLNGHFKTTESFFWKLVRYQRIAKVMKIVLSFGSVTSKNPPIWGSYRFWCIILCRALLDRCIFSDWLANFGMSKIWSLILYAVQFWSLTLHAVQFWWHFIPHVSFDHLSFHWWYWSAKLTNDIWLCVSVCAGVCVSGGVYVLYDWVSHKIWNQPQIWSIFTTSSPIKPLYRSNFR